jgi:exosome complex RNA-binding protein Rrp42 (RNase PH superfamily)
MKYQEQKRILFVTAVATIFVTMGGLYLLSQLLFSHFIFRNPLDFRLSQIENDIFPHCNGSSRVSIRNSIDVICGVKLVVVSGLESTNFASVALDLSPSCLAKVDETKANEITSRIEEILQANLNNSCLQHFANTLTIIPGKFSWSLRIDLIVWTILPHSSLTTRHIS